MKIVLLFILAILFINVAVAQPKIFKAMDKYEVVLSFNSMCCGAPSPDFLRSFLNTYTTKNKTTINVAQMSSCGREGEYKILFSLEYLNEVQKKKFIAAIKKLIPQQNTKNKTAKPSIGSIEIDYDIAPGSIENCRGKLARWK